MATPSQVSELKQQGAIEAAQDPHDKVTADDAQKKIVEESKNAGVVAFTFDPDASPEAKRAQVRAALPPGFHNSKNTKGISIVTDFDDGSTPTVDLPPPTKEGVLEVAKDENGKPIGGGQDPEEKELPYTKTGWAPQLGWPYESIQEAESLLDHTTWVESQLPDHLYGDWYHNAGVIIFACIASWLVAILGGGLGWVFMVMAICSTYYRTSLRRVRRNFRDDITREVLLKKPENDVESLEWINSFMLKFWPIYQPVLAQTVISSVDQVLSSSTPAFLDSLKLKTFTLGSKPPRMEYVKTLQADDDFVIMDWKFSFTPNDTADMTTKQIRNKINPKVVLEIRIGKAMISKGLDVILEDMAFSGLIRLKIKLQIPFPHVDRVEMCFLERPEIDYVCKPLGGDTFGFDINFIPGLETFILEQIHGNLEPMMYAPHVFPIEVAKMLAGTPVDQAIGVVAVTLHSAHGLKNTDNFGGSIDPYVAISLNRRQPLAQTKVIKDNSAPRWNETHYIIITSFNDSLDLQVIDYNEFRKSKELGVASFPLEHLEQLNVHENERLELVADGKARGVISCDFRFFPVLESSKLEDGTLEPPPETNQGILRFTVEQAKDLDGTKSLVGLLNPYAQLLLNGRVVHQTKKLKRTNNPIWDNGFKEMLITDRKVAKLGVTVKDDRDIAGDQLLGAKQIRLDDIIANMEQGKEWYMLDGTQTGRVKLMAQWKPVAISGDISGTGGYITPIGVMRFDFKKATDLRNLERVGKSDPYVRVLLSGIEKARTVTFKNDLNPEWDEVLYVPVHSARERLTLEVMDYENLGRDRSLGMTELFAGDFIVQEESGDYMVHDAKAIRNADLRLHGKGMPKGVLTYTVAFYPCLNIADPEEEEEEENQDDNNNRIEEEPEEDDAPNGTLSSKGDASTKFSEPPQSPISLVAPRLSTSTNRKSLDVPMAEPRTPLTPLTPTSIRKSREEPKGPPVVHLTPEELLRYETGLVLVRLMEADLPKANTNIDIFVDDMAFPSYTSSTAKSRTHKFEEIGDCFIRELDFSDLLLQVREKSEKLDEDDREDKVLARIKGNTRDTLLQCLNNPTVLKLKSDDGKTSNIRVSLKYLPVKMQLDPSESKNNMGTLRVDILDAQNLPAADSNGKSDPYCKFELNGQSVYTSKTIKKTLNPSWNEFFEVEVPSRTGAKFRAIIWDWDMASAADLLGGADIDLRDLEPFRPKEKTLRLDGESGTVRIRLLFRPDYVTRAGKGKGTMSGPTRVFTNVAGVPSKIGQGVGRGTSFLKRGFKSKKTDGLNGDSSNGDVTPSEINGNDVPLIDFRRASAVPEEATSAAAAEATTLTTNGTADHSRKKSLGGASFQSMLSPGGNAPQGTASVTVVSASGFPASADVMVVLNQLQPKPKQVGKTKDRKSPSGTVQFDETFRFPCSPDMQFQLAVKGHHTFSSDDAFGEAIFFIDDAGLGQEKEVSVGPGTVVVKSSFQPSSPAVGGVQDALSPDSPKSAGLRKTFLNKREARPGTSNGRPSTSREGTPVL